MKRVFFVSLCLFSLLLFCLTGCDREQKEGIHQKLDSELEYVEDLIFKIANKHAKGEYIEEDKFKWEYVKNDVNKINEAWGTLVLDLTDINVQNNEIIEFSNELNDLLIAVSKEDEVAVLQNLNDMYGKVIVYKNAYSQDKNKIEKNKIKNGTLYIYSLVNKNDWALAKTEADKLVENYKGLMNDMNYAEENGYNLNKIYVLLEEYRNSIETQNYSLVRMKYITAVENL